jgi:glucose-6-phosphate 1-dehydrogenase
VTETMARPTPGRVSGAAEPADVFVAEEILYLRFATPYEVLLHAAGSSRFKSQGVAECWRIMQPLLDTPSPVHSYPPGSWGPTEADRVVAGHGRWHEPWVAA